MSYFVEGIQGSGKSTLVKLLSEIHPDHKVLEEGDYSPVELAWCAYMDREAYQTVPGKYSSLISEIQDRSHFEDDHVVVCYTKIRTEDPASLLYVNNKVKDCAECGFLSRRFDLSADASEEELLGIINKLNRDGSIDGILVQLPLPEHMDERRIIESISPQRGRENMCDGGQKQHCGQAHGAKAAA